MANTLKTPRSTDYPGELKPVYDDVYGLYATIFGLAPWEIDLHFRGGLRIDQGLDVGGDVILGDDGTKDLTVRATSLFTGNATFDNEVTFTDTVHVGGWTVEESVDDLLWKDDAGQEIIRFGDTASAQHFKVTGPAQITGTITANNDVDIDGELTVGGNTTLGNAAGDTVATSGPMTVGLTLLVTTDLTVNGQANVKGNVTLGDGATDTVLATGPVTIQQGLTVNQSADIDGNLNVDGSGVIDGTLDVGGDFSCDAITATVGPNSFTGTTTLQNTAVLNGALDHNGTTVGFFSSTPITKPTVSGDRSDPEQALKDLLSELANLGLITDSTGV